MVYIYIHIYVYALFTSPNKPATVYFFFLDTPVVSISLDGDTLVILVDSS